MTPRAENQERARPFMSCGAMRLGRSRRHLPIVAATLKFIPGLCAVLLLLPFLLQTAPREAKAASEFGMFRRACVVLQFETDALSEDVEQAANTERVVTDLVRERLSARDLNYPVGQGASCYPRNVARHTTELAFIFHVTLRRHPQNDAQTSGALIFHHQFENYQRPPHQYPTVLFECETKRALYLCVLDQIRDYFDRQLVPELEIISNARIKGKK